MRILVIDDYLNVEMALRGILDGHTVTGVRDPVALPRMLAYEEPFDQAIVDLRYVQSTATGLTALATLRQLAPGTKTIISTTDEEENRLLYLLAAFQFFEPKALLAKRADAFVTRAVVEAIGRGDPSPSPDADPFRKAAAMRPPLLDQLVHSRTELSIWQELARFDKRQDIANAAHVHPRTLDVFTAAKGTAIERGHRPLPPASPGARAGGRRRAGRGARRQLDPGHSLRAHPRAVLRRRGGGPAARRVLAGALTALPTGQAIKTQLARSKRCPAGLWDQSSAAA